MVRQKYLSAVFALGLNSILLAGTSWYAGTWDSTIYNRSDRPRTVGLRIEIVDSQTQIPVEGVQVRLLGSYTEKWVGRSGDQVGVPLEPQEKEFEMSATTGKDGVVVFALGWQKEYPWNSYFGGNAPREYRKDGSGYSDKQSWIRAVDDVEKVERIEIRHPKYGYKEIPFNFRHLLEFGQNKDSSMQEPRIFDEFEQAWTGEIKKGNVKFCVLDLGKEFPDFKNTGSVRPEFFQKILNKNYGTVYQKPYNYFSVGEYPQSECGPYFMYLIEDVSIDKKAVEVEVTTQGERQSKPEVIHAEDISTGANENTVIIKAEDISSKGVDNSAAKEDPFGIAVADLKKERAISLGLSPIVAANFAGSEGLIVEYVVPDSPAYQAGIRENCIITIMSYPDGYQQHLFDKEDYYKALLLVVNKNPQEVKLKYWQFPQSFSGEIDYNKHLKEVTCRLGSSETERQEGNNGTTISTGAARCVFMKDETPFNFTLVSDANAMDEFGMTGNPGQVHSDELKTFGADIGYAACYGSNKTAMLVVFSLRVKSLDKLRELARDRDDELLLIMSNSAGDAVIVCVDDTGPLGMAVQGREKQVLDELTQKLQRFQERLGLEELWKNELLKPKSGDSHTINKSGDVIANSLGMKLVYIPAGEFMMGSSSSEEGLRNENPQHKVKISKGFWMGIYEVTQGQYRAVMGTNPSDYKGDNLPVHWVIWNDATEFCRKLSQKEGKTYRLPTEEEWEYACRAGTDTKFFFGNEELRLDAFAWYSQNSNGQPHPVGLKNPNAWGLYDMCGNVEEWCENVWPGKNIWINVNANEFHILKGGSWKTGSGNCESASLEKGCPREIQQPYACGFRVVLDF